MKDVGGRRRKTEVGVSTLDVEKRKVNASIIIFKSFISNSVTTAKQYKTHVKLKGLVTALTIWFWILLEKEISYMREMKDVCKGQTKPVINPTLWEETGWFCKTANSFVYKAAKETKQQSQAPKETVCLPLLTDATSWYILSPNMKAEWWHNRIGAHLTQSYHGCHQTTLLCLWKTHALNQCIQRQQQKAEHPLEQFCFVSWKKRKTNHDPELFKRPKVRRQLPRVTSIWSCKILSVNWSAPGG